MQDQEGSFCLQTYFHRASTRVSTTHPLRSCTADPFPFSAHAIKMLSIAVVCTLHDPVLAVVEEQASWSMHSRLCTQSHLWVPDHSPINHQALPIAFHRALKLHELLHHCFTPPASLGPKTHKAVIKQDLKLQAVLGSDGTGTSFKTYTQSC